MLAFIVQEVRTVPKSIVRVIGEYELKHTVEVKVIINFCFFDNYSNVKE